MARLFRGDTGSSQDDVVSITTAPQTRQSELDHRERRYVISMTIRTLCFIGAVVAGPGLHVYWLMWILFSASLFLPFVAVVMANSATPRIEGTLDEIRHDELDNPDRDR